MVSVVGGVVRRHVVERAARREGDAGVQPVFPHQLPVLSAAVTFRRGVSFRGGYII